jgi:hypothetical protein
LETGRKVDFKRNADLFNGRLSIGIMAAMKLDKELYRQAYEWYREWNQAELIWRVRDAGKRSPQETWRQYVGLWSFSRKLSPKASQAQRKLRLAQWEEYYTRVKTLENWRQRLGRKT